MSSLSFIHILQIKQKVIRGGNAVNTVEFENYNCL